MRLIVTRPRADAQRWVNDLAAQGQIALALPLIDIGPVSDTSAVQVAWAHIADYRAAMFVSGNAADYFFASKPPLAPVFKGQAAIKTRAWATGPGTTRALLHAGVAPECLDAPDLAAGQFDSEHLWQRVHSQVHPGDRVLIVRGGDGSPASAASAGLGRDWFASRLASVGAVAEFVASYQRGQPVWGKTEQALAQAAAHDGSVWLFSSSEAVSNLQAACPGQSWQQARALATHPRIAAAARHAGFGTVFESRPLLGEVLASIESLQ